MFADFKKQFLDALTSNLFDNAEPPTCQNQSPTRSDGYFLPLAQQAGFGQNCTDLRWITAEERLYHGTHANLSDARLRWLGGHEQGGRGDIFCLQHA